MESIIYEALIAAGGKKVTFDDLVAILRPVAKEYYPKMPPDWAARKVVGEMIANREIHVMDDGKVIIS